MALRRPCRRAREIEHRARLLVPRDDELPQLGQALLNARDRLLDAVNHFLCNARCLVAAREVCHEHPELLLQVVDMLLDPGARRKGTRHAEG